LGNQVGIILHMVLMLLRLLKEENAGMLAVQLIVPRSLTTQTARGSAVQIVMRTLTTQTAVGSAVQFVM